MRHKSKRELPAGKILYRRVGAGNRKWVETDNGVSVFSDWQKCLVTVSLQNRQQKSAWKETCRYFRFVGNNSPVFRQGNGIPTNLLGNKEHIGELVETVSVFEVWIFAKRKLELSQREGIIQVECILNAKVGYGAAGSGAEKIKHRAPLIPRIVKSKQTDISENIMRELREEIKPPSSTIAPLAHNETKKQTTQEQIERARGNRTIPHYCYTDLMKLCYLIFSGKEYA